MQGALMTAADDQIAETIEALALTMRASVFTGSNWSTEVKSDLKCSLDPAPRAPAATGPARTELANRGVLEFERGYTMPVGARLVVDAYGAQRWNVVAGTIWPSFGPGGGLLSYSCEVTKVN